MKSLDTLRHKWLKLPYTLHLNVVASPKKPRATILFIHGIGTSNATWQKVIDRAPQNVRILSIDLLGFGFSPRPSWAIYNVQRQARSVMATYSRLRRIGPLIIVGHSLGALVAVEIAKRYPGRVQSLILCSPPFYATNETQTKLVARNQKILLSIYQAIQSRPEQFVKISTLAAKYGIINRAFNVTEDNTHAYMGALEASIVNQTSFDDIQRLTLPIRILYGTLDAVIIAAHIKKLEKTMENVQAKSIVAGHEIRGSYITALVKQLDRTVGEQAP